MPQIRTPSVGMTRIRIALLRSTTAALNLCQFGVIVQDLFIGENPFAVDNNVLHTAHKARGTVCQVPQIRLQIRNGAAQVCQGERGLLAAIGSFIRAHGKYRLFVIGRQNQVGGVDGHEHLVPVTVIQVGANEYAFPLVQQ